jgi:hypothetical protein
MYFIYRLIYCPVFGGKLKTLIFAIQIRVLRAEIAIDKEIADWVSQGNINVNPLLTNLMKDFIKTQKPLPCFTRMIKCLELCMADNRLLSLLVSTKNT